MSDTETMSVPPFNQARRVGSGFMAHRPSIISLKVTRRNDGHRTLSVTIEGATTLMDFPPDMAAHFASLLAPDTP